ncbi:MazG-like family protein [Thermoanaerobacter uzonensis DSM 18761]|jgi:Ca2+-binding EF-hand superfamily protein|uniref:MazG-like family protein n=1 Tax=Thermoanaerobacter uzonensis DSM 18761 TaxID=1123369 RepID=A0A1M4YCK9_9THEO|nr:MazG-like family protein [Thermoanaerobacter uzonensis]SHF03286.1 MazG-like family protein [Thermoanaerobacter uzonensis DSM 18761]
MKNNLEIAKNIMSIENLKINLLGKVYSLFKAFNEDEDGEILIDNLCDILIFTYLLGEKLGYDFEEIDEALQKKLKLQIIDKNFEGEYNFSELQRYIKGRKRE